MKPSPQNRRLLSPRDAAQLLGISYSTLKQWIYKRKIRTVKTAGGHHRVPQEETDKFLHRAHARGKPGGRLSTHKATRDTPIERGFNRLRAGNLLSGRNQLVGRVTDIQIVGMVAQVTLSIGGQRIIAIVTRDAVHEMHLQKGQTVAALIKSTKVMILRP